MPAQLLINIDVDDLSKGLNFYCEGLGLTIGRRFGPDAVELRQVLIGQVIARHH